MEIGLETLDEQFKKSCIPGYLVYQKIDNNKILIPNFFEHFKRSQKFFIERDRWGTSLSKNSKPGTESIFPKWVVEIFLKKYFIENNIKCDINSCSSTCIYFYNQMERQTNNLISEFIFPHIDTILSKNNYLKYVCLVNLNDFPVTTQFWKYKNKLYCENEIEDLEYNNFIKKKSLEYYKLSIQDKKNFLNNISELKIQNEITYNPNEALIYPLNLYHSPKLEKIHTISNPRVLLRLMYTTKIDLKIKYE